MAKLTLNDKAARRPAPKAGREELWDALTPGFGLRISSTGSRAYMVMGRLDGRQVRRNLGRYPALHLTRDDQLAPGELWVPEARELARQWLADLARGVDPAPPAEPAAEAPVAQAEPADTFKAVVERYLADTLRGGGAKLRTKGELERKLNADLKPWHDLPIGTITRKEIRALVAAKAQTSPVSANRLLSFIKRVFSWAASEDLIEADPARAVQKPGEEQTRKRVLDEREIALFWRACDKLGDPAGRLFKLALLLGQRRGEVAGLRHSELGTLTYKRRDPKTGKEQQVEGDAWLLPAHRVKRNMDHTVPLPALAVALIEGAPKIADAQGNLFDHVLASGARGDQPVTGWSKYKAQLDALIGRELAKDAGEKYDPARHGLPDWHIHDLRATCATMLETRVGVPRPVVARVLNHAEGDGRSMTARYVRHPWDGEAAEALDKWSAELSRIVGENVVPIRKSNLRNRSAR